MANGDLGICQNVRKSVSSVDCHFGCLSRAAKVGYEPLFDELDNAEVDEFANVPAIGSRAYLTRNAKRICNEVFSRVGSD